MRKVVLSDITLHAQGDATVALAQGGGIDVLDADDNRLVTSRFASIGQQNGLIRATLTPAVVLQSGSASKYRVRGLDANVPLWEGTVGVNSNTEQFDLNVRTTGFVEGVLFDVQQFTHQIPATAA